MRMDRKNAMLWVVAAWLCLASTAIAEEPVYQGAGAAFPRSSGFVGGAEAVLLRAYGNQFDQVAHEMLLFPGEPLGHVNVPHNNFEFSPRLWLGYVGESGFGVRVRWFQYQHNLRAGGGEVDDPVFEVVGRNFLDVYAVDIDAMQRGSLGCWRLNGGAGIRVGGVKRRNTIDFTLNDEPFFDLFQQSRFEGIGPSLFVEVKRPLFGTRFSLVGNARGSLLFGTMHWSDDFFERERPPGEFFFPAVGRAHNSVGVGEIQLGIEYACQFGRATNAFFQFLWEGQIWSEASAISVLGGQRDDLGLMGFTFNVGITR
jgi:hypothetical protein